MALWRVLEGMRAPYSPPPPKTSIIADYNHQNKLQVVYNITFWAKAGEKLLEVHKVKSLNINNVVFLKKRSPFLRIDAQVLNIAYSFWCTVYTMYLEEDSKVYDFGV